MGHPYPPSPQVQARNAAQQTVLDRVAGLATSPLHETRAKVRLAGLVPPPGVPTDQQVLDVVAATAPEVDATELIADRRAVDRRARMSVVA